MIALAPPYVLAPSVLILYALVAIGSMTITLAISGRLKRRSLYLSVIVACGITFAAIVPELIDLGSSVAINHWLQWCLLIALVSVACVLLLGHDQIRRQQ
jgi:ABC-type thiamin/hydroxymethylpyrimidine transport system permease subunit